jgi:hypothetical protein
MQEPRTRVAETLRSSVIHVKDALRKAADARVRETRDYLPSETPTGAASSNVPP